MEALLQGALFRLPQEAAQLVPRVRVLRCEDCEEDRGNAGVGAGTVCLHFIIKDRHIKVSRGVQPFCRPPHDWSARSQRSTPPQRELSFLIANVRDDLLRDWNPRPDCSLIKPDGVGHGDSQSAHTDDQPHSQGHD